MPHLAYMDTPALTAMRASLWLLFVAAAAISLFWIFLVLASGFGIWRESNAAGLSLQAALLLFPVGLYAALKKSAESLNGTIATFAGSWALAAAALLYLI